MGGYVAMPHELEGREAKVYFDILKVIFSLN